MEQCGAECVYRWVEGSPADVRVCERTEGPCPHPPAAAAAFSYYDHEARTRKHSAPCAASQEPVHSGETYSDDG
ncbi:MAG: hypothetical protein KY469_10635 [Actinobacteria bacterium]|nr:hypothetical protein [Actinomycetota bacterium]